MGEVLLDGYERYRMYYKGLLDKLGVDVHLFRCSRCGFKSAAEDLVRTGMSAQDRAGEPRLPAGPVGRLPDGRRQGARPDARGHRPVRQRLHRRAAQPTAATRRRWRWRPGWSPG